MQRRFLVVCSFAFFILACDNTQQQNKLLDATGKENKNVDKTRVLFIDSIVDFGKLHLGDTARVSFRFKNVGDKPLFLQGVTPTCGCTIADYPKEAIAPGKEGVIESTFSSTGGAPGNIRKSITVICNDESRGIYSLVLKGVILEPKY